MKKRNTLIPFFLDQLFLEFFTTVPKADRCLIFQTTMQMGHNYIVNVPHDSDIHYGILSAGLSVSFSKHKSQFHFESSCDLANPLLLDRVPDNTAEIFKRMFSSQFS